MKMQRFLLGLCLCWASGLVRAQDIHFSQTPFVSSYLNPSLLNHFNGQVRATAIYRGQWFTVPVSYQTVGLTGDFALFETDNGRFRLGAGLLVSYDIAGTSRLSNTQAMAQLGMECRLGNNNAHAIGLGGGAGLVHKQFDPSRLSFDAQFNGDRYDPDRSTAENLGVTATLKPDFNVGMHYRFRAAFRKEWVVGFAVKHLATPQQNFLDQSSNTLGRRYDIHTRLQYRVHDQLDWIPDFFATLYTDDAKGITLSEQAAGTLFRIYPKNRKGPDWWDAGMYLRFNPFRITPVQGKRIPLDACYWVAGLQYRQWIAHLSYDVNVSGFKQSTNTFGAFEVSVSWVFAKVKKVNDKGIGCPVF